MFLVARLDERSAMCVLTLVTCHRCFLSEDGTFSFGFSQLRGKRPSMEDFQDAKIAKIGDRMVGMFGVFDGKPN